MREKLNRYDLASKARADEAIARRVADCGLLRGAVCIYRSLPSEVSTRRLIDACLADGVQTWLPAVRGDRLKLIRLQSDARWQIGAYGIWEPIGEECDPASVRLDVCVTPLLAADRTGARLGKGKGYYDRFFAENGCAALALAYDLQIVERVPVEPHDKKMDMIVTQTETIGAI